MRQRAWGFSALLVAGALVACDTLFDLRPVSDGGALADVCADDCSQGFDGGAAERIASGLPNVITLLADQNELFYARTTSTYFKGDAGVVFGTGQGTEVGFIQSGTVTKCATAASVGLVGESTLVPSSFFVTDTAVYQYADSRECCTPKAPNPNLSPPAGLCVTIVAYDRWDGGLVGTDPCRPSQGSVCQVTVSPLLAKDPASNAVFFSTPYSTDPLCSGNTSTLYKDTAALDADACAGVPYLAGFNRDQLTPLRVLGGDAGTYVVADYFTNFDSTGVCATPGVAQRVVMALDAGGPSDFIYANLPSSLCDYVVDPVNELLSCEPFYDVATRTWFLQVVSRGLTTDATTLRASAPALSASSTGTFEPLVAHLTPTALFYADAANVLWRLTLASDANAASNAPVATAHGRVTAITSDARSVYWAEVSGDILVQTLP